MGATPSSFGAVTTFAGTGDAATFAEADATIPFTGASSAPPPSFPATPPSSSSASASSSSASSSSELHPSAVAHAPAVTVSTVRLNHPRALAVDELRNRLIVADTHTIRAIQLSSFEGRENTELRVTGLFKEDSVNVEAVAVNETGVFFTTGHAIRHISNTGVISVFAGDVHLSGYVEGSIEVARFNSPHGIAFDSTGALLVCDSGNLCIRIISPTGVVSTRAGNGLMRTVDGAGASASFSYPHALAIDPSDDSAYITEFHTGSVRRLSSAATGSRVTSVIGRRDGWDASREREKDTVRTKGTVTGPRLFESPTAIALVPATDTAQLTIYVTDRSLYQFTVPKESEGDQSVSVSVVAGADNDDEEGSWKDHPEGKHARFNEPLALALLYGIPLQGSSGGEGGGGAAAGASGAAATSPPAAAAAAAASSSSTSAAATPPASAVPAPAAGSTPTTAGGADGKSSSENAYPVLTPTPETGSSSSSSSSSGSLYPALTPSTSTPSPSPAAALPGATSPLAPPSDVRAASLFVADANSNRIRRVQLELDVFSIRSRGWSIGLLSPEASSSSAPEKPRATGAFRDRCCT